MTGIDLAAARADTPACRDRVFLDSAGSSLPPRPVLDAVTSHLRREAEIGGYRAAAERAEDLEDGYCAFAELLGCAPDEVAFTDSASRSWLAAFDALPLGPGDRLLVSEVEYASNGIALLRRAEEAGARVEAVPSDGSGQLDVAALRELLDERVRLVSLVHVPTNGGLVNPVREVAEAAHEVGALVLLDACQSVGQLPVRADELGVDLLSTTGRKWLRGPRGTGVLVVRRAAAERLRPRLVDNTGATWEAPDRVRLRDDARVFELFEYGVAARLGLIAAARYALDLGIQQIAEAVTERAAKLRDGLAALPGVDVRDLGRQRCGIVTFTVAGVPAGRVRDALWDAGVTVTVSPAASTPLDMSRRGLAEVVRASPHYFVSPEQIDTCVAEVARLAG
ncbi:aminotransferase class V-fold PLP-dependent enzyme [Gandjariella thermophila]|uniref:Probable hercynylcysteine sulfoxide lyase n=1 Tax=Gandjariella thermophila TaxID=1931992 RepID=A0A4D4JGB5_9PSEU|nr:aminotransferase class V-fold PLP-dependent enzyme [Gandjariella thermophila]GDY33688.1 aminotransferase class V [Gandjariella thermophila]